MAVNFEHDHANVRNWLQEFKRTFSVTDSTPKDLESRMLDPVYPVSCTAALATLMKDNRVELYVKGKLDLTALVHTWIIFAQSELGTASVSY
jgi:hypothetical protein